jgi:hypothetical protein
MEATDLNGSSTTNLKVKTKMKLLTKFTLITSAIAFFGTISASADDQLLANRLAFEHAKATAGTTVAVFADSQGLGISDTQTGARATSLVQIANGHGQYTPANR